MDSALSITIILAPVIAGISAFKSWHLTLRKEIIDTFPLRGKLIAVLENPSEISIGTIFGLVLILLTVTTVNLIGGNTLSLTALSPAPIASIHLISFTFFGSAIGYLFPHPLTGPLLTIGFFIFNSLQIGGVTTLNDYIGASTEWFGQMQYTQLGLTALLLVFFALVIGSITMLIGYIFKIKTLIALSSLLFIAAFSSLPFQRNIPIWESRPNAFSSCITALPTQINICVPEEQEKELNKISNNLSEPLQKLIELDSLTIRTTIKFPDTVYLKEVISPTGINTETITNLLTQYTCLAKFSDTEILSLSDELLFNMIEAQSIVANWIVNDEDLQAAKKAYVFMKNSCGEK